MFSQVGRIGIKGYFVLVLVAYSAIKHYCAANICNVFIKTIQNGKLFS